MSLSSLNCRSLNDIYLLYDSTVHNETNPLNNVKILQEAPMSSNKFNDINGNHDVLPQHFVNYINYELRLFEEITDKKFFFDTFRNDGFELNVSDSEDDRRIIYRANNLYQFIERLFMIRDYLIKNFDNKTTTSATLHD